MRDRCAAHDQLSDEQRHILLDGLAAQHQEPEA